MSLFEKIFNYQILARLEDSGTFMLTSLERSWLKTRSSILRPLRRYIMNRSGMRITIMGKKGIMLDEQAGFPYKLEYSMVKREWYLLWYQYRHRRMMMSTKLQKIAAITEVSCSREFSAKQLSTIAQLLDNRLTRAVIQVVSQYNRELSRILYAFSCFEKEVRYDVGADSYTIHLQFPSNEEEYILSKIRFLGKRIRIARGERLKQHMAQTASNGTRPL